MVHFLWDLEQPWHFTADKELRNCQAYFISARIYLVYLETERIP